MTNLTKEIVDAAIDLYYKRLYGITKSQAIKKGVCVKCKEHVLLCAMSYPRLYDYNAEGYCPDCAKEVALENEVRLRVLFAKAREGRGYMIGFLNGTYIFFLLAGQNKDFAFATNSKESMLQRIEELLSAEPFFTRHFFTPFEDLVKELKPYVMGYKGE